MSSLKLNLDTALEASRIQAVRQDPAAFDVLYQAYVEVVFRYLYSRMRNLEAAEDATSQTFLVAFETFRTFRGDGHFASWLFGIARHKALDHFRSQKHNTPLETASEVTTGEDLLSQVIASEAAVAVARLVQALPEDERELLRLRYLAELSFPEIGRLLGWRVDTVKKAVYRLVARLHSQLEDFHE